MSVPLEIINKIFSYRGKHPITKLLHDYAFYYTDYKHKCYISYHRHRCRYDSFNSVKYRQIVNFFENFILPIDLHNKKMHRKFYKKCLRIIKIYDDDEMPDLENDFD